MFKHGSFREHPGQVKSTGSKTPPAKVGMHEQGQGPAQAAHGAAAPEHVTKTHPGETQPHPETGVHAVHIHHTGGGKFMTHHHHEDGTVETQHHQSADEAHQAAHESLPGEQESANQNSDIRDGGEDFADQLGGIGGGQVA